jgi:hypothetical protein
MRLNKRAEERVDKTRFQSKSFKERIVDSSSQLGQAGNFTSHGKLSK